MLSWLFDYNNFFLISLITFKIADEALFFSLKMKQYGLDLNYNL